MKQGHFAVLFLVLYLGCFLTLYIEQARYDAVLEEKNRVEESLKKAMEYAAEQLILAINEPEVSRLQLFQTKFLEAFYVYMGVLQEPELQQMLRMYLPMLIVVEEDGAFFCYAKEEVNQDGVPELIYAWSAKQYFNFPENSPEEERKGMIAACLERYASEIISDYNFIAVQYGLQYTFYVPDFLQDTTRSLELPMLFAVFQGWPLTAAGDIVYENCVDASVYIQEVEKYVIELPTTLSRAVSYLHEEGCEIVQDGNGRFLEERMTMEQAVRRYGAVPCNACMK